MVKGMAAFRLRSIDASSLTGFLLEVVPIAHEPLHVQARAGGVVAVGIELHGPSETLDSERILAELVQSIAAVAVGLDEVGLELNGMIEGVERGLILVQIAEYGAAVDMSCRKAGFEADGLVEVILRLAILLEGVERIAAIVPGFGEGWD